MYFCYNIKFFKTFYNSSTKYVHFIFLVDPGSFHVYYSQLRFSHLTDYLTPNNRKGFSTNSIFYIKMVNFMNLVQGWIKFVSFKCIIQFIMSFSVFGDHPQLSSFEYTGDESGWSVFYFVFSFILCNSSQSWLEYIFIFLYFYWILEIACINQSICSTSKRASVAISSKFSNSLFICFYLFIYFWISCIKSIIVAVYKQLSNINLLLPSFRCFFISVSH